MCYLSLHFRTKIGKARLFLIDFDVFLWTSFWYISYLFSVFLWSSAFIGYIGSPIGWKFREDINKGINSKSATSNNTEDCWVAERSRKRWCKIEIQPPTLCQYHKKRNIIKKRNVRNDDESLNSITKSLVKMPKTLLKSLSDIIVIVRLQRR